MHLRVRNVNEAFREGIWYLKSAGVKEHSRNGNVLVAPEPMLTEYERPTERVLFNPVRDANPVFHLMEAIWMLAGQNRVEWLLPFNSGFGKYAEDDGVVWGAYGHRWYGPSSSSTTPQIFEVCNILKRDPESRRAVLQMWDSRRDLGADKRDVPCNTQIYFDLRGGKLNMTVTNRSNDMLWGAYGANVVHMSFLQEWMAAEIGVPVGKYYQFSNNMHLYTEVPVVQTLLATPPNSTFDFYASGVPRIPLVGIGEDAQQFFTDCHKMVADLPRSALTTYFMLRVGWPLKEAYLRRKAGDDYRNIVECIPDCDWRLAFQQWLDRRAARSQNGSE